jgi:rhodanese-related sulfurtransferase
MTTPNLVVQVLIFPTHIPISAIRITLTVSHTQSCDNSCIVAFVLLSLWFAEGKHLRIWQSLKGMFSKPAPAQKPLQPITPEPDPGELVVSEMTPAQVQQVLACAQSPFLLDVREQYEWNQVHIVEARHIPMNRVPGQLADLPKDRPIVVFCAHGSRSFGVAHFLREQGFEAYNMTGGITQWHIAGGPVEVRRR